MAGNTIEKVEIFAVGRWNGMDFEKNDLNLMAIAFNKLKDRHQVPLKMGHNEDQPFTDGQPALGWVTDVFVEGDKLVARFENVPDVVFSAMEASLYKNVSVELDFSVKHKDDFYPIVLSGVALLGADIPAVNTLADLTAFMGKEQSFQEEVTFKKRVAFTATSIETNKEEIDMGDKENLATALARIATLEAESTAQTVQFTKTVDENLVLKKNEIENKAKFRANEDAEKSRIQIAERDLLSKKLEDMVTSKKIAPFSRDAYLADYDQADDKSHVIYAVEGLEKTIDSNPAYFGAEMARKKADTELHEADKEPSQIVKTRAKKYQAEHGEKSFSVAMKAVLEADTELAERYIKGA